MNRYHTQAGFTLIEVAIVFVIIAALLTYTFMPLRAQLEAANIKQAQAKLAEIEQSLYGFAIANGRLPCPTIPGNNGIENPDTTVNHCAGNVAIGGYIGFVPATTLGVKGEVNCDGLLIDPWGRPYMYSITNSNASGNGDFVVFDGIRLAGGPTAVTPDIKICNDLTQNCNAGAGSFSTDEAVAIIFSLGTRERTNSADENENAGEGAAIASTCGLPAYQVGSDIFYYSAQRIEVAGQEFDDIVTWISPNILYAKLLQAGFTLN